MTPVYVYRCQRCDHEWEAIRSMATREYPLPCPECGEKAEPIMAPANLEPSGRHSHRSV